MFRWGIKLIMNPVGNVFGWCCWSRLQILMRIFRHVFSWPVVHMMWHVCWSRVQIAMCRIGDVWHRLVFNVQLPAPSWFCVMYSYGDVGHVSRSGYGHYVTFPVGQLSICPNDDVSHTTVGPVFRPHCVELVTCSTTWSSVYRCLRQVRSAFIWIL